MSQAIFFLNTKSVSSVYDRFRISTHLCRHYKSIQNKSQYFSIFKAVALRRNTWSICRLCNNSRLKIWAKVYSRHKWPLTFNRYCRQTLDNIITATRTQTKYPALCRSFSRSSVFISASTLRSRQLLPSFLLSLSQTKPSGRGEVTLPKSFQDAAIVTTQPCVCVLVWSTEVYG